MRPLNAHAYAQSGARGLIAYLRLHLHPYDTMCIVLSLFVKQSSRVSFHDKTKWHMYPAKAKISLEMRQIYSEASPCAL